MNSANSHTSSAHPAASHWDHGGHDDGITVTDITGAIAPAGSSPGVLGSVLGVYERHGYDAGYRGAVQDVLLSLLGVTEQFTRERGLNPGGASGAATPSDTDAADLGRVVWALREDLERRFERDRNASGWASDRSLPLPTARADDEGSPPTAAPEGRKNVAHGVSRGVQDRRVTPAP